MPDEAHYQAIAQKRILSVTGKHDVILRRTLEHTIADAGPYNQRVDPHHIHNALHALIRSGQLVETTHEGANWAHLPDAKPERLQQRLTEQAAVLRATLGKGITGRVGQALEIAIARGLESVPHLDVLGGFRDLDEHSDNTLYSKDGPPSRLSGRQLPNHEKLDFLVRSHSTDAWGGIEAKNIRPWIYIDSDEFRDLIRKSLHLGVVPVLIARRIHFTAGTTLRRCGGLTWQTLRQRYPFTSEDIAFRAKDKRLLGYADITLGNHCDGPLANFLQKLPTLLPDAQSRLTANADLLDAFSEDRISSAELITMSWEREQNALHVPF